MTLVYNIEPAHIDIIFKQGDTIDISFSVELNDVAFDMTGMQLDIKFRRKDNLLVKLFSSSGISPAITIVTSTYNLYSISYFLSPDVLDYDVQVTSGSDIFTIQYGEAKIKKEIT
jgi:hypothetical protein